MDAASAGSPEKAAAGPSAASGPLPYPPGSACPGGGEGLLAWSLSLWGAQGRVGMSWAWGSSCPRLAGNPRGVADLGARWGCPLAQPGSWKGLEEASW